MIYVGIDVAKFKHDCFIMGSSGVIYEDALEIDNSLKGFTELTDCLEHFSIEDIRIGLEATGHYSQNIVNFLQSSGYDLVVFNPLRTTKFRKAFTLRKTKTDRVDARTLARILAMEDSESYSTPSYHAQELKSLTRHRLRMVKQQSKLKTSLTRLAHIMFPELSITLGEVHTRAVYALLSEYSIPATIKKIHLTHLTSIFRSYRNPRQTALDVREAAASSIGTATPALVFELRQVIPQIEFVSAQIKDIDRRIKALMTEVDSSILSVPGIGFTLGASILGEIRDISLFNTPAQLLAFAGMEPSTNQSGQKSSTGDKMVKRGSSYLRRSLYLAAEQIVRRDPAFIDYYAKKKSEGKHHEVVLSHVARKLVRVLFYLLKNNVKFVPQKH